MSNLRHEGDDTGGVRPGEDRPARVRPHWRRGGAALAAAVVVVGIGLWWEHVANAPTQQAQRQGLLTTGQVVSNQGGGENGDRRVCIRYHTPEYAVKACPLAASARDPGSTVRVRYLADDPTVGVIDGDAGSTSTPLLTSLWIAAILALYGLGQVIGRRPRPELAQPGDWSPPTLTASRAVIDSPLSHWSSDEPAMATHDSADDVDRVVDRDTSPVPAPLALRWTWSGVGLHGRRYVLTDPAGTEVARIRGGHLGHLRAVSTDRREYRIRSLGLPIRIRAKDAASGELIATWLHGKHSIAVEGGPELQVAIGTPTGGQSPEVGLVGPDGSTLVRVRFEKPFRAMSLYRSFPTGAAMIGPERATDDDILLAVLAFQVLAISMSPNRG